MLRLLLSLLRPLPELAKELRLLRELYELDLASRTPPVYRLTEKPSKRDTEVTYQGQSDDTPRHKRWFQGAGLPEDEDVLD